jgi:hypothetical protein
MKKVLLFFVFIGFIFTAKSQNASVEKSVTGIQTGVLGIWVHNETKLSNPLALRTEVGMDFGFWSGDFYPKAGYAFAPVITIEPRWYYNLNKRLRKSKNISGNSGNFLTLQVRYYPDWFTISNYKNVRMINTIAFIPTWGIRRVIGKHFTYEAGVGYGFEYIFYKSAGYSKNEGNRAINLLLRIGYRF